MAGGGGIFGRLGTCYMDIELSLVISIDNCSIGDLISWIIC